MPALNAKGKPFSWSFTALTNFESCPKRYAGEKFYCTVPFVETEATRWGNRVHSCAEQFMKEQPVKEPELLPDLHPFLDILKSAPKLGRPQVEMEIALTRDLAPTSWFGKEAWFRGKIDLSFVPMKDHSCVHLLDWKTGKPKDDTDQLKIFCAAYSRIYPGVARYVPKYIWLKNKTVSGLGGDGILQASELPNVWAGILGRVARMEQAWAADNFPARPSALCPWCSQYDGCGSARRR